MAAFCHLLQKLYGKLRFGPERKGLGELALLSPFGICIGKPFLRDKEPASKETVPVLRCVGGKDADLAVSTLPTVPEYCRATPAESSPFLTKADSSKIRPGNGDVHN